MFLLLNDLYKHYMEQRPSNVEKVNSRGLLFAQNSRLFTASVIFVGERNLSQTEGHLASRTPRQHRREDARATATDRRQRES